jgi:putative ABC transport system permease protein
MMRLWRAAKLALFSLAHQPLRSALTVLGIVLGVASVIAMLAIASGAAAEAQRQIQALGSTTIRVFSKKPPEEQGAAVARARMVIYGVKFEDATRIRESLDEVEDIVAVRQVDQTIYYGSKRSETYALATTPRYLVSSNQTLARGRWFTEVDMLNQSAKTVLGSTLARKLFDYHDPIGEVVRIGQKPFTVIGVLDPGPDVSKLGGAAGARSADVAAFIPLPTVRERWGERNIKRTAGSMDIEEVEIHELIVKTRTPADVLRTTEAIKTILHRFHKKEDYYVRAPLELLVQARETSRIFSIVLGSIAGISLVVGGIGIMNIMLATVTERTREIGIRRALGARRRDITLQFLVEALVLSTLGGALGVALGLAVPWLVTLIQEMQTQIEAWTLLLSFGISAGVGVLFGIYPAVRASFLDPIEALRHE